MASALFMISNKSQIRNLFTSNYPKIEQCKLKKIRK